MRRRDFIGLVGGAAVAWPLTVRAQQQTTPVIGFLSSRSPGESAGLVTAFRQGLREAGFVDGENVVIAFRWAEGRYDRLQTLAAELVPRGRRTLCGGGNTVGTRGQSGDGHDFNRLLGGRRPNRLGPCR